MPEDGAVRFAEKLLALLEEGLFTATYKYAVLLGLLDLSLENVSRRGDPPDALTTRQLADKVIEIYWPQAVPFSNGDSADVLLQNAGGAQAQAEIVRWIQDFRIRVAARCPTGSLVQLRQLAPADFDQLRDRVEWKLIEMPLPRVQIVGNVRDPFLYTIGWDTGVRRSDVRAYQAGHPSTFDNRIQLRPGVGAYLIQFNAFLRPLIHRQWAGMVARVNRMEEARLERFLFGSSRNALNAVRPSLRELQQGHCFYCRGPLRSRSEVDHFIPWSRYPEDGLANLVLAHDRCNQAKRDFLPATEHVIRWSERLSNGHLLVLQDQLQWHAAIEEMRGVTRGIYLRLPVDAVLWVSGRDFDRPDLGRLRAALT